MAYGQGCWLSSHTDHHGASVHPQERLIAWMLYLTHPEDGEWSGRGGAVRVWDEPSNAVRLDPRFNRFALFRVSPNSFHEIEELTATTDWEHCRLALSGWIRKPVALADRRMAVYRKATDSDVARATTAKRLAGSIALHRLWKQQRLHCHLDDTTLTEQLDTLERSYESNDRAPPGTSFVTHMPGPKWSIVVVDEDGETLYFGPRDEYERKAL
jgi:hypothetical protein